MAKATPGKPKVTSAKKSASSRPAEVPSTPDADRESYWHDWREAAANKIFPRNLTAQASYLVPGNPVVTRPEDAVANCYPGLELDVRNLDRRFFPGLVFNFVEPADPSQRVPGKCYGAVVAYNDFIEDPDLQIGEPETERLYEELKKRCGIGNIRTVALNLYNELDADPDPFAKGVWYLDWIEQKKRRLSTKRLTGLGVWRLVRGLQPGLVTIGLRRHDHPTQELTLKGWRRLFTDPVTGVINGAYQPGELMQGLCSPWQHDFRDCACHYWASNHPDIVMPEVYPGELLPGGEARDPVLNAGIDWLRADRSPEMAAAASDTIPQNRPYQIDHFQINRTWQQLNVVLENREIGDVYVPEVVDSANPYQKFEDLIIVIRNWLAPMEMALALEYLYAYFSLKEPKEIKNNSVLSDTVDFVREHLLLIAISEMQHLRWANELLWGITKDKKFQPVLEPSELIPNGPGKPRPATGDLNVEGVRDFMRRAPKTGFAPPGIDRPTTQNLQKFMSENKKDDDVIDTCPSCKTIYEVARRKVQPPTKPVCVACQQPLKAEDAGGWLTYTDGGFRPRQLRALTPAVQADYIMVEHQSGFIDSTYARVVATLQRARCPDDLVQLPMRILNDGMRHESEFIHIQAALKPFANKDYLRNLQTESKPKDTKIALDLIKKIVAELTKAYQLAGNEGLAHSSGPIAQARSAMFELLNKGDKLAGQKKGKGIPFFYEWDNKTSSQ
jgi:hypothetical protein